MKYKTFFYTNEQILKCTYNMESILDYVCYFLYEWDFQFTFYLLLRSLKMETHFLDLALEQAHKALSIDEVPVGCVVVQGLEIVSSEHNLTNTLSDPLAHAEYLCIKKLVEKNESLENLYFYITLEPCAMCAGILERINANVVFGYHNEIFGAKKILNRSSGKCLEDERCVEILRKFYETPNKNVTAGL
ncbi:hypothetical protein GINT2_000241 [Glugoides intestinalis]